MTSPRLRHLIAATAVVSATICTFGNPANAHKIHFGEETLPAPQWILDDTIYELNVRQFSEEGTFAAAEKQLDRIQELGIQTVWLMPIHPIGKTNRKGTLGSYYSIADYKGINPEFGDKESFRSFVKAAHKRGLKIVLDWVANHSAWENPWTKSNPDFYAKDPEGNFMPPHGTDWTDVIQLDFNNQELWTTMIDAMAYWINEYDIDGYRCDFAAGVPTDFWNEASKQLRKIKPDFFMLAESYQGDFNLEAFHASYAWERHHAFNAIAQGKAPASHLDDILAREKLYMPKGTALLTFTSNHDENSWAGTTAERMGPAKRVFDLLSFTMPGIPLIYNGQEASLDKRLEFFERDPIEWKDFSESEYYSQLIELKRSVSALHGTGAKLVRIPTTANEKVFAFRRENKDSQVVVFANLSNESVHCTAACSKMGNVYRSFFSGQKNRFKNTCEISLEPWAFEVFVREKE
ncbi:alpha-amylase family glycosyl hydrolase [Pelagicoccus mobilis]|uniref:Glycosyl hydrolase family 13 catalytic domain-containing protein n=1 Tax=Pelagicoccus mobilis TaxID=415221 RepID=A0A934RSC1_9BACT|nr:alpha-amylase family glycosyl hydrolase [Pelagicoccus mobilis]MBK1876700.1 hypothetical protein [Pelagicoccus mobilis]